MTSTDGVRRFLVTGPDDNLMRFHLAVCTRLNAIERRRQTVIYTCFAKDAAFALEAAERCDVTVQEIEFTDAGDEEYPVRHTASHGMQWVPRVSAPEADSG